MELPQPPISEWYSLLLLGLPGIWLLARTMVFYISDHGERRAVLLPGLAVTIWLLAIHIFGLLTNSFGLGLTLGTVVPSISGWALRRKARGKKVGWPYGDLLALAIIAPAYLVPTMINSDFHDKLYLRPSHFSVVNNILNGIYPPRDAIFPRSVLRYHYGVNTLAATISTTTRTRFDVSLDIISFLGLSYAILAFGTIGGALFGPSARVFVGFLGAFHGGLPWLYPGKENETLAQSLMGFFHHVNGSWLTSPSTSTLFQMPFSLGYPLFALTLLLLLEFGGKELRYIGSLALMLVLATLSFSNITLFLTTGGAVMGSMVLIAAYNLVRRTPGARAIYFIPPLIGAGCSFIIATFISGFSDIILSKGPPILLKTPGGIAGSPIASLHWHWGSFGLLLPLALPGLILSSQLRAFFLIHVLGCLYTLNTYRYRHTWDIVKFGFVAAASLSILSAGTIAGIWRRRWLGKPCALALSAMIAASAITFHIPFWRKDPTPLSDTLLRGGLGHVRVLQDELKAIEWLREHAARDEVVLRVMDAASLYPTLGGLAVIQPIVYTPQWGFAPEEIERRNKLTDSFSAEIADYKREGVRWIVIHKNPAARDPYVPIVAKWVKSGECNLEATFGDFEVYRVL